MLAKPECIYKINNHIGQFNISLLVSSPEISMSVVQWNESNLSLTIQKKHLQMKHLGLFILELS